MESTTNQVHWNLRRIVKGDGAATAWLFDTFGDRLYRRLRSRYQYPGGIDAEDLLQDAFVFYLQKGAKVLRDFLERVPDSAQTPERLERHLWDLACGLAANRRRSLKRKKDEPLPDDQWLEETKAGPAEEVMGRQEMELLDSCLEGAGSKVYLYYKLRYWGRPCAGGDRADHRLVDEEHVPAAPEAERCTHRLRLKARARSLPVVVLMVPVEELPADLSPS